MASARDNDIVIECSPYSDSETEIKNLKSMSYELIPTIGDIFTTDNSVSNFVLIFSIAGALLVLFPKYYISRNKYIENCREMQPKTCRNKMDL